MQKLLFDKINIVYYNGVEYTIRFRSFRPLSGLEHFYVHNLGSKSYYSLNELCFEPKTAKQFINCLKLTKPTNGKYAIYYGRSTDNQVSFEELLKLFIDCCYAQKYNSLEEKNKFIKTAMTIKNKSVSDNKEQTK